MKLSAPNLKVWAKVSSRQVLIACPILAACLLTVLLRLHQAKAPMVFDEYASMYFSDHPLRDLWGWWLLRETNPPLFYSVLKLWRMSVPENQAALRLLPMLLSIVQIAIASRFAAKTYGWLAGLACIALFAISPSDIYQSEYVRGYGLAKLAVTISFIGLVAALNGRRWMAWGWAAYVVGAVVAVYSHTTMLLWPVIVTLAVVAEAAWKGDIPRALLIRLLVADIVVAGLASWELAVALFQMQDGATNISWIEPLSVGDFASSANLQLLLAGSLSSVMMGGLIIVGALRTLQRRVTRLSLLVVTITVVVFKIADFAHPITTDYTLHWCATFTVFLACAALSRPSTAMTPIMERLGGFFATIVLVALVSDGLKELNEDGSIPTPQDWRYVVNTLARAPDTALLVSHESIGLVVKQACKLQFHNFACPFPLVVMQNPARSDNWSFGGYGGRIIAARDVRQALGSAHRVFVFSRYVYTPLAQLGMDPGDYHEVEWDDGELIGPIPVDDFDKG